MKLRVEQLAAELKNSLACVYWLSGDEPLLLQEAADLIRSHAKAQGFTERTIYNAGKDFDWQMIINEANSLSLFADKKILDVRLASGTTGSSATETLKIFSQLGTTDTLLLVSSGKIDKSSQKSAWYKILDSIGVHVEIWPIDVAQLPAWIMNRLKQAGLRASPDVGRLLAERVEGNLLAAAQEIERLKLLVEGTDITADTLIDVGDHARYNPFILVESALQGDIKRTLRILHGLKAEGEEPSIILWALTREIRQLIKIAYEADRGKTVDQACEQLRVFYKQIPLIKKNLQRHSRQRLESLLQTATQIDQSIKGLRDDNTWDALTTLSLRLAGIR